MADMNRRFESALVADILEQQHDHERLLVWEMWGYIALELCICTLAVAICVSVWAN